MKQTKGANPCTPSFLFNFPLFTPNKVWNEARPFRWDEATGMIWTGKQIMDERPSEKGKLKYGKR